MYLLRKLKLCLEKSLGHQTGKARILRGTDSIDVYTISWNETIKTTRLLLDLFLRMAN